MFLFYFGILFSGILFPSGVECSFFGGFRHHKETTSSRWFPLLHRSGGDDADTTPPPLNILFFMDSCNPFVRSNLEDCIIDDENTVIIHVLSDYLADYNKVNYPDTSERSEAMRFHHWKELLEEKGIPTNTSATIAVHCESDSGLADAEALRQQLVSSLNHATVYHDNPIQSEARRYKPLMHQCIERNTSLLNARQRLCHSLDEALEFWEKEGEFRKMGRVVVVKQNRGVGSEPVRLCRSRRQVKKAWHDITSAVVFGGREEEQTTVVMQEYIQGTEYAVDIVSRNGQHKVAAIWRRYIHIANTSDFCYYQSTLVDTSSDENVTAVCDYVKTTLDALGVQWGLSNNIVIVTSDSQRPMLVDVSCRQHNIPFADLTEFCIGYNAFKMLLDAYFGGDDAWAKYPELSTLDSHGLMVSWIIYVHGWVVNVHHLDDLAALPSVLEWQADYRIPPTWVQLVNDDPDALRRDFEQVVAWMPDTFLVKKGETNCARWVTIRNVAYLSCGILLHYLVTILSSRTSHRNVVASA